jgi:aspartyl-tRNA(Asn)/glutamyl-tRNA(Gln) amidotransferase subunit B
MNRSGVPLIEIVTRPELSSAEEVEAFLDRLRSLLRFARISGAVMAKGELRCDVNLSVKPVGSDVSGVRVELKNMNSVEAIKKAIKYETERHIRALEGNGPPIVAESRGWDEGKSVSFSMRTKESAADYRYFPDANIPPLYVDEAWLSRIRAELPELPEERKRRYTEEYGLSEYDAGQITSSLALCLCFEEAVKISKKPKDTVNWLLSEVMSELNSRRLTKDELPLSGEALGKIIILTAEGKINRAGARRMLPALFDNPKTDPTEYAERNGLTVSTDTDTLYRVARETVAADPKSVADYLGGREKAFMALFGKCMKALGGNCDPQALKKVLAEVIGG